MTINPDHYLLVIFAVVGSCLAVWLWKNRRLNLDRMGDAKLFARMLHGKKFRVTQKGSGFIAEVFRAGNMEEAEPGILGWHRIGIFQTHAEASAAALSRQTEVAALLKEIEVNWRATK